MKLKFEEMVLVVTNTSLICLFGVLGQVNHCFCEIDRIVHQINDVVHDLVHVTPQYMNLLANGALDEVRRIWLHVQNELVHTKETVLMAAELENHCPLGG